MESAMQVCMTYYDVFGDLLICLRRLWRSSRVSS